MAEPSTLERSILSDGFQGATPPLRREWFRFNVPGANNPDLTDEEIDQAIANTIRMAERQPARLEAADPSIRTELPKPNLPRGEATNLLEAAEDIGFNAKKFLTPSEMQSRELLVGGGSVLGTLAAGGAAAAAAGSTGGITVPGSPQAIAAGGLLGAAGGSLLADVAGFDRSEDMMESITRALEAGAFDAGAFGVAGSLGRGAAALKKRIFQVNENLVELGKNYGMTFDVETATGPENFRRIRRVLSQFPLLNEPFAEGIQRRGIQAGGAVEGQLDELAPRVGSDLISNRSIKNAEKVWSEFQGGVKTRYATADKIAKERGVSLDPRITRERALSMMEVLEDIVADVKTGNVGEVAKTAKKSLKPQETIEILGELRRLDDSLTFQQVRDLKKRLGSLATQFHRSGAADEAAIMRTMREALDLDLRSIKDPEVVGALKQADAFYHRGKKLFEGKASKSFQRVNPNIFEPSFDTQGNLAADELLDSVMKNADSPQAINQFRRLLGDTPQGRKTFNQATRNWVQKQFDNAVTFKTAPTGGETGEVKLDLARLRRDLGLFDKDSPKRRALSVMLSKSGVKIDQFEEFITVLDDFTRTQATDVSAFVARRTVLGGPSSGARSALPNIIQPNPTDAATIRIAKTVGGAGLTLVQLRKLGRFLNDPAALRMLTNSLKPNVSKDVARASIIKLGRIANDDTTAGDEIALGAVTPLLATRGAVPVNSPTPTGAARGLKNMLLGSVGRGLHDFVRADTNPVLTIGDVIAASLMTRLKQTREPEGKK